MYRNEEIAQRIKEKAKEQKITIKQLVKECELGINAISQFKKGNDLSCISLAKIADKLNVTTDYLLGRDKNL